MRYYNLQAINFTITDDLTWSKKIQYTETWPKGKWTGLN